MLAALIAYLLAACAALMLFVEASSRYEVRIDNERKAREFKRGVAEVVYMDVVRRAEKACARKGHHTFVAIDAQGIPNGPGIIVGHACMCGALKEIERAR